MPIELLTIEKYGKPYLTLNEHQTLFDLHQQIANADTYLIVSRQDGQFQVALLAELLTNVNDHLGKEAFTWPLAQLPLALLPLADEIVSPDITESGKRVVERAKDKNKRIVVVQGGEVIGLFTRTPRGGLFESIFNALHGNLTSLVEKNVSPPPTCPHCGHKAFFGTSPDGQKLICKKCQKVV